MRFEVVVSILVVGAILSPCLEAQDPNPESVEGYYLPGTRLFEWREVIRDDPNGRIPDDWSLQVDAKGSAYRCSPKVLFSTPDLEGILLKKDPPVVEPSYTSDLEKRLEADDHSPKDVPKPDARPRDRWTALFYGKMSAWTALRRSTSLLNGHWIGLFIDGRLSRVARLAGTLTDYVPSAPLEEKDAKALIAGLPHGKLPAEKDRSERMIEWLAERFKNDPAFVNDFEVFSLAHRSYQRQEYERAKVYFEAVRVRDPRILSGGAQLMLAKCYTELGLHDQAIEVIESALKDPTAPEWAVRANLAESRLTKKEYDKAHREVTLALNALDHSSQPLEKRRGFRKHLEELQSRIQEASKE